jgi:hypothetical protein
VRKAGRHGVTNARASDDLAPSRRRYSAPNRKLIGQFADVRFAPILLKKSAFSSDLDFSRPWTLMSEENAKGHLVNCLHGVGLLQAIYDGVKRRLRIMTLSTLVFNTA